MGKKINDPRIERAIIEALKSGSDLEIEDGSLLESVFSERGGNGGGDSGRPRFSAYDPKARFPFLSFIYRNFCTLLLLLIWAAYRLASRISTLLTGRKTDYNCSVKLNGIVLFTSVVATLVAVASMMVFFIKDIMFRSPEMSINSRGAIVLQQPCKQEYYVYLMNSSDSCSNTGISLSDGDRVEVSYSGSFYGDICDMVESSIANIRPRYSRSPSRILGIDTVSLKEASMFRLRHNPDSGRQVTACRMEERVRTDHYGSLLWAVCGESYSVADSSWNELSFSGRKIFRRRQEIQTPAFTPDRDGLLYFCVNDGYKKVESEYLPQWSDNLGELLLTIKVTRRVPSLGEEMRQTASSPVSFFFHRPFSWMTVSYRWLENNVSVRGVIAFFLILAALFAADHWTGRLLTLRRNHF